MDERAERPKSLKFKEPVIDVAFSPSTSLVASSLITGHVFIHRYSVEGNQRAQRHKVHKKSCRSVCFSEDGNTLYTASKDRSWQGIDMETGNEVLRISEAHNKPINLVKYVNERIVATGDEAGGIKLWDIRKQKPTFSFNEHVDYISDMTFYGEKRHLLATSGDGCLSVYDVRKAKPFQVSANQDDELLSVAVMRGGKKVIVGETDGVLGIFSYGQFGDVSDRFPGHPQSIDTICKLTEDLCVTGSSDGLLRIVQLFPHKLVGVAGDHSSLPAEKVVLSYDQQWLASCSHDHSVHFWDIGYIFNEDGDEEEEEEGKGNGDKELDAQEMAIRISKQVGDQQGQQRSDEEDDSVVDIDGVSDISELIQDHDNNEEGGGSDTSAVDIENTPIPSPKDSDKEEDSWDDSDSDGGGSGGKKRKARSTKRDKKKTKRRERMELANPKQSKEDDAKGRKNKKRGGQGKAFFADL